VALGPALGEDASLQVGPESDWRLDRCSRAPVAAIYYRPAYGHANCHAYSHD
jgi:hypothetical protein